MEKGRGTYAKTRQVVVSPPEGSQGGEARGEGLPYANRQFGFLKMLRGRFDCRFLDVFLGYLRGMAPANPFSLPRPHYI